MNCNSTNALWLSGNMLQNEAAMQTSPRLSCFKNFIEIMKK